MTFQAMQVLLLLQRELTSGWRKASGISQILTINILDDALAAADNLASSLWTHVASRSTGN